MTFGFFLAGITGSNVLAAEEAVGSGAITRPVMEYKAAKLRDPFKNCLSEEKPEPVAVETPVVEKPQLDLSKLTVQGIIWGVKIPQAIINGMILTIGDKIEGAEILSIEKKGITLSYGGGIFDLSSPGLSSSVTPAAKK